MSDSQAVPATTMACPDPLEKIFQQVEEQNERRAQQEEVQDNVSKSLARAESSDNLRKSRRRGSISITRFGQLSPGSDHLSDGSSGQMTPALSDIASKSPFYQAQLKSQNGSQTSFASGGSGTGDAHDEEDDHHVTHMHTIAPRQSISRAVGGFLPRRLSRARSSVLPTSARDAGGNMVISVAAATVELPENAEPSATVVHAPGGLRNQTSKSTIGSSSGRTTWTTRAKEFTKKFRRKSKIALNTAT